MSVDTDSKVIGYFAFSSPMDVVCEGDACIISGSEQAMRKYLQKVSLEASKVATIKKTRFSEIIQVMTNQRSYHLMRAQTRRAVSVV